MTYSTSPSPYSNTRNRSTLPSSGPGTPLRVFGLLLSLASIVLALLAVFYSIHEIVILLLAVIIFLFGARVFSLWLGARARSLPPSNSWQPAAYTPEQPLAGSRPVFLPPQFPAREARPAPRQFGGAGFGVSAPVAGNPYQAVNDYELPTEVQPAAEMAATPLNELIEQDEFFSLDRPITNERCFLLPKEGEPLVECQDRYALAAKSGYRCYAVADGVAGSFVPGPWARVVAKGFVERAALFTGKDDFQSWLAGCSQQWHHWIEQRWVPTINTLRERNGDSARDWSYEIRQGAQTTLIGCIIDSLRQMESHAFTAVEVFAIGDSELFHFTPDRSGGWNIQSKIPYEQSWDFDAYPPTLITVVRPELVERSWMRCKTTTINASAGDLLVLATDTLAKWILTQIEQQTGRWQDLLSITTPGEFEQYVRREFHHDRVEDDDVTMLVIPI